MVTKHKHMNTATLWNARYKLSATTLLSLPKHRLISARIVREPRFSRRPARSATQSEYFAGVMPRSVTVNLKFACYVARACSSLSYNKQHKGHKFHGLQRGPFCCVCTCHVCIGIDKQLILRLLLCINKDRNITASNQYKKAV